MSTLQSVDLKLLDLLTPWEPAWLDVAMIWISSSGGAGTVWLVLAIVSFVRPRHRAAAWRVILTVLLAYLLVDGVIKPLVARPRPVAIHATDPKRELPPLPRTFSFPSGHATSTFGAAVAVSRMWPQTRVVWWTLAVLIGYSRIYLGHHYPLDVAGGAVLGVAVAFWVLGGRHPATYSTTLPKPLPSGVLIRP
jgi:undecaprenyl-diphosphatase